MWTARHGSYYVVFVNKSTWRGCKKQAYMIIFIGRALLDSSSNRTSWSQFWLTLFSIYDIGASIINIQEWRGWLAVVVNRVDTHPRKWTKPKKGGAGA